MGYNGDPMAKSDSKKYLQCIAVSKEKPASFYDFKRLYWCGLRLGEMLTLTPSDFNFEGKLYM